MKVLVTGAGGFLGRRVVNVLLERGHTVRAMVRPASDVERHDWDDRVEVFRADLRGGVELDGAFEGVDALVHLATAMNGDDFSIFAESVTGTERLFDAMKRSSVKRLLLCSSFSVYDWDVASGSVDEKTPTAADIYKAGGYSMAKLWQERLARRLEKDAGVELTVLRPSFIWGKGNEDLACLGQRFGSRYFVFGGARRLALTHVDNCADCFGAALDHEGSVGETFNVVDSDSVRAWNYAGHLLKRGKDGGSRVYLPSWFARLMVWGVNVGSKVIFGERGKLPSMFVPCRYRLRFVPMRYPNRKLAEVLGWKAPVDYATCLARTFDDGDGEKS